MTIQSDSGSATAGLPHAALRDAVAVLLSSAGLLAKHIDRLPREIRDRQLSALLSAATQVHDGVEALLESRA